MNKLMNVVLLLSSLGGVQLIPRFPSYMYISHLIYSTYIFDGRCIAPSSRSRSSRSSPWRWHPSPVCHSVLIVFWCVI